MPVRHLVALMALLAVAPACSCSGGGIGDNCSTNADCDVGFCQPTTQLCTLPGMDGGPGTDADPMATDSTPGVDSGPTVSDSGSDSGGGGADSSGVDSGPGTDMGAMGTDSGAPFLLVPSVPTIDPAWACSASVAFSPVATSDVRFNTDTGEIFDVTAGSMLRAPGAGIDPTSGIRFEVATQTSPMPGVGVFSFDAFTLPAGVTLVTVGANALGIFACGEVHVEGVIDGRGDIETPGPGAYAGGRGYGQPAGNAFGPDGTFGFAGENDVNGGVDEGGGGGGGFGGTGGAGGDCSDNSGGPGGTWAGSAMNVPLRGGGGGGAAGCSNTISALGGGGGGAVWIGANGGVWIEMVAGPAGINVGGGGGMGCPDTQFNGGGGGGAGGAILIEAPTLILGSGAVLSANGGGGGGGSSGAPGMDGASGGGSGMAASGGTSPGSPDGVGGDGGSASGPNGGAGTFANDGGGGGGGGAGRIRVNTASGSATLMGVVSPGPGDLDGAGTPLLSEGVATAM